MSNFAVYNQFFSEHFWVNCDCKQQNSKWLIIYVTVQM